MVGIGRDNARGDVVTPQGRGEIAPWNDHQTPLQATLQIDLKKRLTR
jgi:hypothetical protein